MINKRIFGTHIPVKTAKKLEARQNVAVGDKKPLDEINSNYKDDRQSNYKYNEQIASNFDMQADLSSRTPFARMWTAIALVNERAFSVKPLDDSETSGEGTTKEEATTSNALAKKEEALSKIKYKELARSVYIIGTNNLSTIDSINPLDSVITGNGDTDAQTQQAAFPQEHGVSDDFNKFLKPQAGIVSVTSETEGTMGSIKKTTVNFIVHNFADYDNIYNKYFMRPGAQVVVDFGWDVLKDIDGIPVPLYDPQEIIDDKAGVKINTKLYGEYDGGETEDGFVTKCNGDVETLIGIVTGYDSKILENGSVECSVTLTSKNSALINSPKTIEEDSTLINAKFEFDIDQMIFFEQSLALGASTDREAAKSFTDAKDTKRANSTLTTTDELQFDAWIDGIRYDSFGSDSHQPSVLAAVSGLFVVGSDKDTSESYISWGFLEDRLLNRYFGHGADVKSMDKDTEGNSVKIDSSKSFTTFDGGFIENQEFTKDAIFLVPDFWDKTYSFNHKTNRTKAGLSLEERVTEFSKKTQDEKFNPNKIADLTQLKEELDEVVETSKGQEDKTKAYQGTTTVVTQFDKKFGRIPLREIFVSTKIIKDAFTSTDNNSFKQIVDEILEKINEKAYGLWEWKLAGNEETLSVYDVNFTDATKGAPVDRDNEYKSMFKFEVMSKNSIIKNYDVSLSMPEGDIGSMYAIQAMSGTPGKMYPINKVLQSQSALQTILNNPNNVNPKLKQIGFRYLPDMSTYNALTMASEKIDTGKKIEYFKNAVSSIISTASDKGVYGDYGDLIVIPSSVKMDDEVPIEVINETPTGGHNTALMNKKMKEKAGGAVVAAGQYEEYKLTGLITFNDDHAKSIPLPMKLEITIYGIGTLIPGDSFRVDYLPQAYLDTVYFQILKVSHSVGADGWYTSLETQFRVSPHNQTDDNFTTAASTNPITDEEQIDELDRAINEAVNDNSDEGEAIKKQIKDSITSTKPEETNLLDGLDPLTELSKEGLNGPGALTMDIDDKKAYLWNEEATGFSTRYTWNTGRGNQHSYNYHQRPETWKPNDAGTRKFDYIGGGVDSSLMTPHVNHTIGKYKKIITNYNFDSLKGYMQKLTPLGTDKYKFFSSLLSFEIFSDYPVYIANPLYFWSEDLNRYNGYGEWTNTYSQNGSNRTYVGGVYLPGEKCYLIVNTARPQNHWAVVPRLHANGEEVNLQHYNYSTKSPNWSTTEWEDEGWKSNNTPDRF